MAARKPARNSKSKGRAPSRGASRSGSRKTSKGQVPGWVWLFTGLMIGLFVAFLFHLGDTQINQGERPQAKAEQKPAEPPKNSDSSKDEPRFDFYAVLPKMEVIVPQTEKEPPRPAPKPKPTPPKPQTDTTPTAPVEPTPPPASRSDGNRYLLQAGSFRSNDDADRRRAELILQGFSASVQSVSLDSGDTWHRVMIGPYNNRDSLNRAQEQLASNGIETLPIRMKD